MANQLGKMYVCEKCGSQFIVTKAGDGAIKCCGQEMQLKK
jgi:desulfoferrodoxin-like iron-binding protein